MTLDSNSRLVQCLVQWTCCFGGLHYRGDNIDGVSIYTKWPPHTTLCRFFWRAFVFMPLAWVTIIGLGGFIVGGMCIIIWQNLLTTAIISGAGLIGTVIAAACYWLCKTKWSKFCPIIHIK